MLPSLLEDLERGSTFIAVGESHLFGINGLITLLSLKGYVFTAVED